MADLEGIRLAFRWYQDGCVHTGRRKRVEEETKVKLKSV